MQNEMRNPAGAIEARPAAIAIAPNGGRKTRADHAALPLSSEELADCAEACLAGGASMIHLHVRDGEGRHCLDTDLYRAAIDAVHKRVGTRMIVQVTTEAVGIYAPERQIAMVRELRPQAVSLALRELVPDQDHELPFVELLEWMRRECIIPQIILYDRADMERLVEFRQRGLLAAEDIPVLFVLGRYAADHQSEPADLLEFLAADAPGFAHWTVCAFGRREAACAVTGALLGGHARIGFENNLFLPDGRVAGSNAELLQATAERFAALGIPIDTADGQREALARIW